MRKPEISFANTPVYNKKDKLIFKETGKEVQILDAFDGRNMSDQIRPHWKDGMLYTIMMDDGGTVDCHWWEFEPIKK